MTPSHLRPENSNQPGTQLFGRWLFVARFGWIILTLANLAVFTGVMSLLLNSSINNCGEVGRNYNGCNSLANAQILKGLGLPPDFIFYAWTLGWRGGVPLGCTLIALVLFWRKSYDWLVLLTSFELISLAITAFQNAPRLLVKAYPEWGLPVNLLTGFYQIGAILFLFTFPNGDFSPRWTRLALLFYSSCVILNLTNFTLFSVVFTIVNSTFPLLGIAAQVYRYRCISNPLQRQQTKWIVLGLVGPIVVTFIYFLTIANDVLGFMPSAAGTYFTLLLLPFAIVLTMSLPLSFAFSVLRYQLWDIDNLVNRALVYSSLTTILLLLYIGSVVSLQNVLRNLTGQGSEVAIVISTLLIAALFQPLRRLIQSWIDRRFYRRKYDAAKTLEAFNATLRVEVDLNTLRTNIVAVVEEAMQPAQVSLWLREPERKA